MQTLVLGSLTLGYAFYQGLQNRVWVCFASVRRKQLESTMKRRCSMLALTVVTTICRAEYIVQLCCIGHDLYYVTYSCRMDVCA